MTFWRRVLWASGGRHSRIQPSRTSHRTSHRTIAAVSIATPDPNLDDEALERFMALLASSLAEGRWHKLILARPVGSEHDLQRVVVRPLVLRGQPHLSFVSSHTTRDITKNLPLPDGLLQIRQALGQRFRNAHLHTPSEEFQLRFGKKGTGHLSSTRLVGGEVAALAAPAAHDREKQRWIDITRPFLVALGVTTAQHQLVPAMARKWKQINKFVEIFAHALESSRLAKAEQLRVVDFGAGKGYLSFALHDWLRHSRGMAAEVSGVELRADLVAQGKQHIADLGLQGLQMQHGDVRDWNCEPMDVMIALHACDTATDHAIYLGLRAGAQIILCSPCCHKQLRPQLLSPHPLRSVFQHGIHAEQQAEMVTDSLRALLLQAQGYDTQVFEFVALEHTRKNKMILAVKRALPLPAPARDEALQQVAELKQYLGGGLHLFRGQRHHIGYAVYHHAHHATRNAENDHHGKLVVGGGAQIEFDAHVDDRHDDAAQIHHTLDEIGCIGYPGNRFIAAYLLHPQDVDAVLFLAQSESQILFPCNFSGIGLCLCAV